MRWLITVGVLLLLVAACGRSAPKSPETVPWLPLAPQHHYASPPMRSPAPPLPVPDGTPVCTASQLEAIGAPGGAATGHVLLLVLIRNRGTEDCQLDGFPDIGILDANGAHLADAAGIGNRGTFFEDVAAMPVLLARSTPALAPSPISPVPTGQLGQAYVNLEWMDCRRRQASTLLITLPGSGGMLSAPFGFRGPYSPACDTPGYASNFGLTRGPISESGIIPEPIPDYFNISITVSAPATASRGQSLAYQVRIANHDSRDLPLDPCPDYNEFVGAKRAGGQYQLNCGPVGVIRSGDTVVFDMTIQITSSVAPGMTSLNWVLLDGRIQGKPATADIQVH